MVLDMEGEFYKIAKRILEKPNSFYKMLSLSPATGRMTLLGAEGGVIVGPSLVKNFIQGPGDRAFELGQSVSRDLFGSLIEEFDEEIKRLGPKKLTKLGIQLCRSTGWGDFDLRKVGKIRKRIVIDARKTVELGTEKPPHHMFTLGLMTGIVSLSMGQEMEGTIEDQGPDFVRFSFKSP